MRNSYKVLLITTAVLSLFATVLGLLTAGDNILDIDLRISGDIQRWQGDFPEILHRTGDMLGGTAAAVLAVGTLIVVATILRSKRFVAFFIAVGLFRLAGILLKPLFDSPRPIDTIPMQPTVRIRIYESFESTGYPSGHSMTAAMLATIAIVLVWNITANNQTRWITTITSIAYMVLVGWSRIWSGAHWPTDVLGGWSYGIALVLLAWIITTPFACSNTDSGSQRSPG